MKSPPSHSRDRRPAARCAPVPFVLALAHRFATSPGTAPPDEAVALRLLQAGMAEELGALERACWRGELDPPGLQRLQQLRVGFAALDGRIEQAERAAGEAP